MKKLFYYFIKYTSNSPFIVISGKSKFMDVKISQKMVEYCFHPIIRRLLDPLLVGCNIKRPITSLTRSDVFGGPLQWFMDALNMLPVYRIRNGYANLKKNEAIFKQCKNLLSKNQWIMMFSEAAHHDEFYLQSLSKAAD